MGDEWIEKAMLAVVASYVGALHWFGSRQIARVDSMEQAIKQLDTDFRNRMDRQRDRDERLSKELRQEIAGLRDRVDNNHKELLSLLIKSNGAP